MAKIDAEDPVLEELVTVLSECGIKNFQLDTDSKKLVIKNREDFDSLIEYLESKSGESVDARTADPRSNAPYGDVCTAWFDYNGWHIRGMINIHKEE